MNRNFNLASLNGQISPLEELRIPVLDRGYLFGDSVYEGIRLYQGAIFLFDEHLARLKRSLSELQIPFDVGRVRSDIHQLLQQAKVQDCFIYLQISRGVAPRSHCPPTGLEPNLLIFLQEIDAQSLDSKRQQGLRLELTPDPRWQRCDIKSTNLLGNTLAAAHAVANGSDDVVFYGAEGIRESSRANIFFVKDNVLVTPALSNNILPGVTRNFLLTLAPKVGLAVEERAIALAEVPSFEECFLTGTVTEMIPVKEIRGHSRYKIWSKGTQELFQMFRSYALQGQ